MPASKPAALVNHPETPCGAVESIQSFLRWARSGVLSLTYVLKGALEELRIPPYRSARRADHLWRHTCFEAFIGAKNDAEYFEWNISPSGEWAVNGFRDYREIVPVEVNGVEPRISLRHEPRTLELSAELRLDQLPGLQLDVDLWVALSAVIEDNEGKLSYWALKHAPGKPDFHHPDNFLLELKPPQSASGSGAPAEP